MMPLSPKVGSDIGMAEESSTSLSNLQMSQGARCSYMQPTKSSMTRRKNKLVTTDKDYVKGFGSVTRVTKNAEQGSSSNECDQEEDSRMDL